MARVLAPANVLYGGFGAKITEVARKRYKNISKYFLFFYRHTDDHGGGWLGGGGCAELDQHFFAEKNRKRTFLSKIVFL